VDKSDTDSEGMPGIAGVQSAVKLAGAWSGPSERNRETVIHSPAIISMMPDETPIHGQRETERETDRQPDR